MALQDVSIYKKYPDYGAGKAKLYAGIAGEVPQEYFSTGISEAVDELSRLAHYE